MLFIPSSAICPAIKDHDLDYKLPTLLSRPPVLVFYHRELRQTHGKEVTISDIVGVSGVDESDDRQVLCMAVAQNIFSEPRPGFISRTTVSRLLVEDSLLSDLVACSIDDLWQPFAPTCNSMAKYPGLQEPTQSTSLVDGRINKSSSVLFDVSQ